MEHTPYKIIMAMKYEATDNFVRGNSLCRDDGVPVYNPQVILELVPKALEASADEVERINIHEQEFLAALNLGKLALARKVFEKISKWFPPSKYRKAKAYEGFILELEKNYEKARNIYTQQDCDTSFYPLFSKRLVALSLAEGDRKASIARLVNYLDVMAQDTEAWSQLAKLYLYESMNLNAAFCYEELIIINANNHVLNARYADVLYTLGRQDMAIKYYCKSLTLYPDYLHALYGICLCAKMLLCIHEGSSAKGSIEQPKVFPRDPVSYDAEKIKKLHDIAHSRIRCLHAVHGGRPSSRTADVVNCWLDSNKVCEEVS